MPQAKLTVRRLKLGPMENFIYLLADRASREAAVVDPAWDVPAILAEAETRGLRIASILLTHHHHDHTNGVRELREKTGARVFVGGEDAPRLGLRGKDVEEVADGAWIRLGERVVRALATPGHTAGSRSYLVEGRLFSGDTLFVGACGRCDLEDSSAAAMRASLTSVIGKLPDTTLVHPGHDYDRTAQARLGRIKRTNPAFGFADLSGFAAWVGGARWKEEE